MESCYKSIKQGGLFIIAFPNLSSIYARIELLLGFQPHCLQISNVNGDYGIGFLGKMACPNNKPIHHIRGITCKAMKEMLLHNKFKIIKILNCTESSNIIKLLPPSFGSTVLFVCTK